MAPSLTHIFVFFLFFIKNYEIYMKNCYSLVNFLHKKSFSELPYFML